MLNYLEKNIFDSNEVCDILGICHNTLYRMIASGKMPYIKVSCKCYRFTKEMLEKYMADNTVAV